MNSLGQKIIQSAQKNAQQSAKQMAQFAAKQTNETLREANRQIIGEQGSSQESRNINILQGMQSNPNLDQNSIKAEEQKKLNILKSRLKQIQQEELAKASQQAQQQSEAYYKQQQSLMGHGEDGQQEDKKPGGLIQAFGKMKPKGGPMGGKAKNKKGATDTMPKSKIGSKRVAKDLLKSSISSS